MQLGLVVVGSRSLYSIYLFFIASFFGTKINSRCANKNEHIKEKSIFKYG
jgi:hypothetical protein